MRAMCSRCGSAFETSEGWLGAGPTGDEFLCGHCGRGAFHSSVLKRLRDRLSDAWFTMYDLEQSGRLSAEDCQALYRARRIIATLIEEA